MISTLQLGQKFYKSSHLSIQLEWKLWAQGSVFIVSEC